MAIPGMAPSGTAIPTRVDSTHSNKRQLNYFIKASSDFGTPSTLEFSMAFAGMLVRIHSDYYYSNNFIKVSSDYFI